ncbi:MAG: TonB-dependent receptor [Elusimicrobia bacterium]|nr:TonB-dependent receptor [Elusimicrobiota bacterium]
MRIARGDNSSFGVDYGDFDEGIGAMLSSARYFLNKDAKWHTRRLSSFMKAELAATDTLKVTPIIYHKADQIVNDTGFSNTVTRNGFPPGTIRYYKQQASRTGIGLDFSYIPIKSLSLLWGVVYESDTTENEDRNYAVKMNNDDNIIGEGTIGSSSYINRMPVFYRKLYSAYGQCIYEFTSEFKGIGGGRYEKDTFNRGEFIPRLGLVWDKKLANERELISKLLWGKSYRALANYERFDVYNLGGLRKQPIDLSATNPERASTFEYQTIYLPDKRVKYDATAWCTRVTDKILEGTEGYTIVNGKNISSMKETTYGAILGTDVQLRQNLLWEINYTYTAGKNGEVHFKNGQMGVPDEITYEKLLQIAPHKINSHVNYSYNENVNMDLGIHFVGERNADPQDRLYGYGTAAHGTAPGYTTVDLHISSKITKVKGLSASFLVSNLLNEKYVQLSRAQSDYVSYYEPQPGRRAMLTLKWMR